jgi:hypothetical protein
MQQQPKRRICVVLSVSAASVVRATVNGRPADEIKKTPLPGGGIEICVITSASAGLVDFYADDGGVHHHRTRGF